MSDRFILAIDQGTTSTRAFIFDDQGQVVSWVQKPLDCLYPQDGWVEQDAKAISDDVMQVVKKAIKGYEGKISGIGITNQRETTIAWRRSDGQPLYNAIVWQDRRTADFCEKLKSQGIEDTIKHKTGLVLDPYFSATKMRWILDNCSEAQRALNNNDLLFGTVDSYVIWKLTEGQSHVTDVTNASRTQLFNIRTGQWDDELLGIFDIPPQSLPDVLPNTADFGRVSILGLEDVLILGVAGDQQAALIGQGCLEDGQVKSTYGTGCFMMMNTGERFVASDGGLLTTVAYKTNDVMRYALEGAIFNAGTVVQWLRDQLGLFDNAQETGAIAKNLEDNGGVYFVPALTGLGAPYWAPHARGTLVGLQRSTHKDHIIRAGLEAQAYQTQALLELMVKDTAAPIKAFRVDGGMVANDWLCQFMADICQIEVLRPDMSEATIWGAAWLAGLQAGLYKMQPNDYCKRQEIFEPSMADKLRDTYLKDWAKAVQKCLYEE